MVVSNPAKIAISHAHSKVILVGEHAVVYGQPAIALPFPLKVTSTVEAHDGEVMLKCSYYHGPIKQVPLQFQGIVLCVKATLAQLKEPFRNITIRLHSDIPIGRGLGSSAAIAIAIVKSIFSYYERTISHKELMDLVHVAEVYAHGNPSGIDMYSASRDVPIWFQKQGEMMSLPVGTSFHFVVADSGQSSDTLSAVQKVQEQSQLDPGKIKKSMEQIGRITQMAKGALAKGDTHLLGKLLNENHKELKTLGVSNDQLDHLIENARNEGAIGAKLTGGGCGGCVIALAPSQGHAEKIAKKLRKAGAHQAWPFTLLKSSME